MPKTIINRIPRLFTRRALISAIQSQHHDREQPDHAQGTRPHSRFPLMLTVGLMTIGVIAIISILQLLSSYLG